MSQPRSRDITKKQKAENWLENNKVKAELFNTSLAELRSCFVGNNDGYVDFSPPEYRFNNKKIGGYVIVTVRKEGTFTIKIFTPSNLWKNFKVTNSSEFLIAKNYLVTEKVINFEFNEKNDEEEFYDDIQTSMQGSSEERKKRLASSDPKAQKVFRNVAYYKRNPDVVAEVLINAEGVCQSCLSEAPFKRAKDNTPYLEVHHKIRLADNGPDTVDNSIALCPNCHRAKHYG